MDHQRILTETWVCQVTPHSGLVMFIVTIVTLIIDPRSSSITGRLLEQMGIVAQALDQYESFWPMVAWRLFRTHHSHGQKPRPGVGAACRCPNAPGYFQGEAWRETPTPSWRREIWS